ncbi:MULTISPECIES: hypothetical protein [Hymenobacter]|uniref:Uncharacterized protein n=1 Tax=Hymenobacter mucosus TaxID=1411120 RepID=A0A239AXU7_9BACT|nr:MULTISPECIES: hypothetical protein [Hymenobacter]MDF7815535.1 hypothetical protein [Hymenobacter sp. YC55]SNS00447.1 hypothetical protein SAMN06269173_11632 [Hymenobacter mucosus]
MDQEKDFTQRIDELALDYLHQAVALGLTPTDDEFVGWVDAQPLASRPGLYRKGWAHCWAAGLLSFQEWVLLARGMSLADYLVQRLSEKEYLRWVELFATSTLARPK